MTIDTAATTTFPRATPPDRSTMAVVAVLSFAIFMTSLDLFIVNLAFPYIGREYPGTSLDSLSWILNGYTIVFAATLVPAGRWADRVGRRRMFLAGLITFGAGSLACGLAPGVNVLIAARVVQAIGGGAMVVRRRCRSCWPRFPPPRGRTRSAPGEALGALGAALGPVIGGLSVQASWRWCYGSISRSVWQRSCWRNARCPRAERAGSQSRPDVVGATLLAAGVGLLTELALVKVPDWGGGSARFLGAIAAALACRSVIVARSSRHPAPVVELGLLRSRTVRGTFAASLLYYAGFGAFTLSSVVFLTEVWHYSPVRAGLAIAPRPADGPAVRPAGSALADGSSWRPGSGGCPRNCDEQEYPRCCG